MLYNGQSLNLTITNGRSESVDRFHKSRKFIEGEAKKEKLALTPIDLAIATDSEMIGRLGLNAPSILPFKFFEVK